MVISSRLFLPLCLGCVSLVADSQTATTTYSIQTIAGTNTVGDGGPALAAIFSQTEGIALDSQGNIYVADADNNRVRKIAPDYTISTVAGTGVSGFSGDGGPATQATLSQPYGLAVDVNNNLYIADLGNARVRELTADGNIHTVAGGGTTPLGSAIGGLATNAQLAAPRNVAFDPTGTLYISDFGANIVYRVSPAGILTILAGTGASGYVGDGGTAVTAELNAPAGLAVGSDGSVYIADSGNNCIRRVSQGAINTILAVAVPTGVAVSGGSLYVAASNYVGTLYTPFAGVPSALDVTVDGLGNVYLTTGQFVVEITVAGATTTIAGSGQALYFGGDGGPASAARFHTPSGIASDSQGNKYIADTANNRIREITLAGSIATIAGTGAAGSDGDGAAATLATLNMPESVAVDSKNNIYIADTGNNKVRKITPDGNISTVLDNLAAPEYVAVDSNGNLYVADTGNDRVLQITPSGTTNVFAQVLKPAAVLLDSSGNAWISELTRISEVSPSGVLTPVVDNLKIPRGLAFAANGALLIAETGTNLIRGWTSTGGLVTIAGTGMAGYSGDGGAAPSAQLNDASDLVVDSAGIVWIADTGNNCIRIMTPSTTTATPPAQELSSITVVNAASLVSGGIAPGEIVTIFGSGFDPKQTQLSFDGNPATTFFIGANQINALAPSTLTPGATTQISISVDGAPAATATANVVASAPGIFTIASGLGQAAAINQDGTVNSPSNPAPRGSTILLFATGQGQGSGALSVTIGGYSAVLQYAGSAPGFAGLMQINAQIPGGFLPPGIEPVTLTVGNASSQNGVTIALR